jgi:hypothetical protein
MMRYGPRKRPRDRADADLSEMRPLHLACGANVSRANRIATGEGAMRMIGILDSASPESRGEELTAFYRGLREAGVNSLTTPEEA